MMRRIVVVEDHAPIAEGLRLNLTHDGYDVVIASTGPRGLTEVRSQRPDLMILDLTLPGMDGLEVLRTLRAEGTTCRCWSCRHAAPRSTGFAASASAPTTTS
jgi:DNA-binding response OmpR family regulator